MLIVTHEQLICQSKHEKLFVYDTTIFEMEGAEMEAQCRKEYVSVNIDVDQNGELHPRFIRWTNGQIFQIDKLLYKCRAASSKVSGGGIRYTVSIHGKKTFLFLEGNKWFVEAKEEAQ